MRVGGGGDVYRRVSVYTCEDVYLRAYAGACALLQEGSI